MHSSPISAPRGILIVGNHSSAVHGNRAACEDLSDHLEASGWKVVRTSRRKSSIARLSDMLMTTWRYRRGYQVAQVDVFSGRAMIWAEAVCTLLRWIGKPYVLTLHGGNLPDFSRGWPRRVRRLLGDATFVTTPSGYLHEEMEQYRGDLRGLANPIDLQNYSFRLRALPSPRLVWLRAFHTMYNPSLAALLMHDLRQDTPDAQLSMIGPDKGDGSLLDFRRLVAELSIEDAVQITGAIPKESVPSHLNESDIFINTTNVDNAPVSVTEAMACGLCIVSTNVGGIPHLLEHEQTALLVPPNDPPAMAAAVRRILKEPELAEFLSRNARAKAETFTWDTVLPQWEELITDACDFGSRRIPLVSVVNASSTTSSSL